MISFSIAPKLLALYLLLMLSITADDSIFTNPPLGQQAAVGFSPSVTDTDDAIMNQPVIQNKADLQRLSGALTENTKSFLLSDGENVNCADSPYAHKRLSRSSQPFSKRQQNDFCSPRDDENFRLVPPSYKPGASDIPAGPQDDTGFQRSRGSIGGANEFIPDPLPDMKKTQLYGKPNRAMCPNTRTRVPVCSPFDQKITSPADSLVPCRFWKPDDWCADMEGVWEDLWCCAFAYVYPSIGWEMNVIFKRYPGTGLNCVLQRSHFTDN